MADRENPVIYEGIKLSLDPRTSLYGHPREAVPGIRWRLTNLVNMYVNVYNICMNIVRDRLSAALREGDRDVINAAVADWLEGVTLDEEFLDSQALREETEDRRAST